MIDKLVILNCIIFAVVVTNFIALMLIYYFVNRNWEQLIEHSNQLNQLQKFILITRDKD